MRTYENTFDGVSEILFGKCNGASGENGGTGDPIVKSEAGSVDGDWVQVGKASNLVPQVEPPIVHHDLSHKFFILQSRYRQQFGNCIRSAIAENQGQSLAYKRVSAQRDPKSTDKKADT